MVSFRVTVCDSTGQDARLMPQGDVQQESCSVCLALILAGFFSPPVPSVLVKGSVRGLSPRLRTDTATRISAVGSRSCL